MGDLVSPFCEKCGYTAMPDHACERADFKPTSERLTTDCVSVVQQMYNCWDGEVDVICILVRKDSTQVQYASTVPKDKIPSTLNAVISKSRSPIDVMRKLV